METGSINPVTLPRREMLNLLLEGLKSNTTESDDLITTHFAKRLVGYEQDSAGVTLNFQDGSSAKAHVLVGADGIGSSARKAMYTRLAEQVQATDPALADDLMMNGSPIWAGVYIYRFLVDANKIREIEPSHIVLEQSIAVSPP